MRRIDLEGRAVEGGWLEVPLGIPLHLELHRLRGDVTWAAHNRPWYGTVCVGSRPAECAGLTVKQITG